ncbi:DNA repair protein XRCC1 [Rhynchophorus ferrugineus]|uniref:DNA repair protein XRCC1 n=1 Tax=Rhynchophorus ferrugineus TaxID=354439 RepID=UPI003FCDF1E5
MPGIKIERIVCFNSEDNVHVANNLLTKETTKKWKCKTAGEKTATVVFQLDQPHVITGIDIGNEHSAYIEVMVSRSTSPEDYKVFLVMSSFMTPLESRQSQNINKVRMFKQKDFSETERNEKWDRVKIICTQPFNRHVQYGLSFVNFYSNGGEEEPAKQSIGKFTIRAESPDNISAGSLFARVKKTMDESLKGAAAIREAFTAAQSGSPVVKPKLKHNFPTPTQNKQQSTDSPKARNRNELLYSKDEEDSNEKIDKLIEQKAKEKAEAEEEASRKKELARKQKEQKQAERQAKKQESNELVEKTQTKPNKRKSSEEIPYTSKKKKKEVKRKPFSKLLENVVLVISGIQNPDRANLRTMALSMGAKYKPDWDKTCTHLVCAFANTPKFNQVKGKGKIVTKKWIEECHSSRKRLPWRRFALDKADKGPESEEEVWEEDSTLQNSRAPPGNDAEPSDIDDETKESGVDVDEIIDKIQKKQEQGQKRSVYDTDTDSEPETEANSENTPDISNKLKNIFDHKIFYIDEVFGEDTERKLKQYIVAYKGLMAHGLENSIDIIITNEKNSSIMKDMYPSALCLSPDWIWECHNTQEYVSMDSFIFD